MFIYIFKLKILFLLYYIKNILVWSSEREREKMWCMDKFKKLVYGCHMLTIKVAIGGKFWVELLIIRIILVHGQDFMFIIKELNHMFEFNELRLASHPSLTFNKWWSSDN